MKIKDAVKQLVINEYRLKHKLPRGKYSNKQILRFLAQENKGNYFKRVDFYKKNPYTL